MKSHTLLKREEFDNLEKIKKLQISHLNKLQKMLNFQRFFLTLFRGCTSILLAPISRKSRSASYLRSFDTEIQMAFLRPRK